MAGLAPFDVVIVLHDSAPELERLLDSVDAHLPERPRLIVVDTASGDGGAGVAVARSRGVDVVLEAGGNPGFGPANNLGVARAETDVTVLLNPDTELRDDGLARLAERARTRDALLVPTLLGPDGTPERSAHPRPASPATALYAVAHAPLLPRRLRERVEPWRVDHGPVAVGWAVAACLAARTAVLRRLGPFDPDAFLFYEDLDLCLRAAEAGVPTELHPDVAIAHTGHHSTGRDPGRLRAEARRRRQVVGARLGRRAQRRDDAEQALTFVTRIASRRLLGRDAGHERAQLAALRAARREPQNRPS